MSAVAALIWFVCMTMAVFLVISAGVFLAARSGNPRQVREERVPASHVREGRVRAGRHLPAPHLSMLWHRHKHA